MVSQASKLLDDAREQAVADARRKAEIYAKAAGVTLGAPLSISEEGAAQPLFRARMAAPMAAASVPVAQGEETLSITVGMTWAIKAGSNSFRHCEEHAKRRGESRVPSCRFRNCSRFSSQ